MSLLSHRLDKQAFEKYAQKKYDADDDAVLPDADAFTCWDVDEEDLVVIGFDDGAKEALRAANADDPETKDTLAPELVISWCSMDRVSYIVRRVEEKLRIPQAHWYLAAEGHLLKPETVACNSVAFSKTMPELTLVPKAALDAFKQSLQPHSQTSMQKAVALFGLTKPLASASADWTAYLKQRKLCNALLQKKLAGMDDESEPNRSLLTQIRSGTADALRGLDVEGAERTVTPWTVNVEDDGNDNVRSADIFTRLHSLARPAAVDVRIWYWHKTRYYSVEWSLHVEYRVSKTVSEQAPSKKGGKWKKLVSMGLEDTNRSGRINKWNPREVKTFGMTGADVRAVRAALFGDGKEVKVSMVDTVRLLLAGVGICIRLRTAEVPKKREDGSDGDEDDEDEDDDENSDRFDSFQCSTKYDSLGDPRWLGVHIRRACSAVIPSDADFVDRAAEPRYSEDEDEDEDGEYGHEDDLPW